eukprot:1161566-Pelagomonas_calceolata.AAC.1
MQTLNGRGVAPISNTSTNLVAGRRAVQFRRPASQQQARSTVKAMAQKRAGDEEKMALVNKAKCFIFDCDGGWLEEKP